MPSSKERDVAMAEMATDALGMIVTTRRPSR
jgi:hypothetical protein